MAQTTRTQEFIQRSLQLSIRISNCSGETKDRLHLRDTILAFESILQFWKDDNSIPESVAKAIHEASEELASVLNDIELGLQDQQLWPYSKEITETFVSKIQTQTIALREAAADGRDSTSGRPDPEPAHVERTTRQETSQEQQQQPPWLVHAIEKTHPSPLDRTPFPFMLTMSRLKRLRREGWARKGIEHPESVAAHSFGVALMGFFAPRGLDKMTCVAIGMIHDMAESIVGDITPHDRVPKEEKRAREREAVRSIVSNLACCDDVTAVQFWNYWLDYDEGRTPEGKWVKETDKLECYYQAHIYKQEEPERDLEEFEGLESKITLPDLKDWLNKLQQDKKACVFSQE
ncbi:hypothetical protein BKA56DRAFT_600862 [Ilyonectria sp. MPI-CAGE-AT-0026]|nr:hypothetical protein BKA56DRAFT_600862 [Ilyonectria sp. MPI-CAGE-AT-0026]